MADLVGVTHDDLAALETGTNRRGCPRPFLPSRVMGLPVTPDKVRHLVAEADELRECQEAADEERRLADQGECTNTYGCQHPAEHRGRCGVSPARRA